MTEPKERLVAHALIIGAVKGAVTGLFLAALPAVLAYSPAGSLIFPLQIQGGHQMISEHWLASDKAA